MYSVELEIKDTTESNTSAFLPGFTSVDRKGRSTSHFHLWQTWRFQFPNSPFLSSNIPTSPAYGVFISQLIRYARACSSYGCFIPRATRISNRLLEQGYVKERLKSSLRKFYGRYGVLIKQYKISLSQILNVILWPDHIQWQPPTDQTFYRTRPFIEFWVVSIEHLRRVWHAGRGRLLLRTPGPVPLGLAYVLLVESNSFPNLSSLFRYKYLVLGREGPCFVKEHSDSKNKYTEEDIIKMLEFLVDNIFVVFAGNVFQQIVGIPMGTKCAPLLADIFLY